MTIDITIPKITIYNSLPWKHQKDFTIATIFFKKYWNANKQLICSINDKTPQQSDVTSCGLYVISHCISIYFKQQLDFSLDCKNKFCKQNVYKFRIQLADDMMLKALKKSVNKY